MLKKRIVTGAIAPAGAARAQTHQHGVAENQRERYVIPAVRIDQAPRLDSVLDDQMWQKAAVIQEFTQQGRARARRRRSGPRSACCTTAARC